MRNTIEQARAYPPGTVINPQSDHDHFVRTDHGGWVYREGSPYSNTTITGYNVPDTVPPPAPFFPMSLPQLQRSVRNIALGQSSLHGVRGVETVISHLLLPAFDSVHPGDYVHRDHYPSWGEAYDNDLTLAVGSFRNWDQLTLVKAQQLETRNYLGPRREAGRIFWVPGDPGEEVDHDAVLAFKQRLWEVGLRGKGDYSWCGVFESTVGWFGIDESIVDDSPESQPSGPTDYPAVGSVIRDYQEQALLPVGTILQWGTAGVGSWNWVVRRANADNEAGTVNLLGTNRGQYGTRMTLIHLGDTDMRIPLTAVLSAALPVDSRIMDNGVRRIKNERGWGNRGRSFDELVNPHTAVIVEIPGVNA
jgi:hypothetical protein